MTPTSDRGLVRPDYVLILNALHTHLGGTGRLAHRLGYNPRTVRGWLSGGASALSRAKSQAREAILSLAKEEGVDVALLADGLSLWDAKLSYEDNYPFPLQTIADAPEPLEAVPVALWGHRLLNNFGPAASILTSCPERVKFLADSGNGIITFKTVRTEAHRAHLWPNLFVADGPIPELSPDAETPRVPVCAPGDGRAATTGTLNRYGMPSPEPAAWQAAFREAQGYLRHDQLLICSVVGTMRPGFVDADLAADFAKCVSLAAEAGANVVELNLSCPNSSAREALVYRDAAMATRIVKACRSASPDTVLLANIGYMNEVTLQALFDATHGQLHGYTAINTLPVRAYRVGPEGQEPAFGDAAPPAGLSGKPVLALGLDTVGLLAQMREAVGRTQDLSIIGVGGVSTPSDVQRYLRRGADAVQGTTIFMDDPLFGLRVHKQLSVRRPKEEAHKAARIRESSTLFLEVAEEMGLTDERSLTRAVRIYLDWRQRTLAARVGGRAASKEFWRGALEHLRDGRPS